MTYAPAHRPIYDADSHVMELPNFLRDFADPQLRDEIALVNYNASPTEAAYRRSDPFGKRRELVDAWASYCRGERAISTGTESSLHTPRHSWVPTYARRVSDLPEPVASLLGRPVAKRAAKAVRGPTSCV